jgi:gliding motility-associated lipoprotein GldH
MKRALTTILGLIFIVFITSINGCTDGKAVIDKNDEVGNHNWIYLNKFRFDVKIDDENVAYNQYINLRITADYKYSNMFVLVTQIGPDKKSEVKRYELQLADKEGKWLGDGSGNLYSYQIPLKTGYKFPSKGIYSFYIEQNMRDNPLREVSDVGLRVEKSAQ